MNFDELRKQYQRFLFKSYEINVDNALKTAEIIYHFEIEGLDEFRTRWVFPVSVDGIKDNDEVLLRMAFNLGMVEAISYYKITCPKVVEVKCGELSDWQNAWWKKLFYNGLGEFMYINDINVRMDELLTINAIGNAPKKIIDKLDKNGYIVPIGGGKDSVVTLELLKDEDVVTFCVNQSETVRNVIECADFTKGDIALKRILDKKILEYNSKGYLNGHIPFSAVLAFSSCIAAYLNGKEYIALSNENSANESTIKGSFVNHQYSKSYEFEQDFRDYINDNFDTKIYYFSYLRPIMETEIAMLFAEHKAYHKAFRSCNKGSKQGIWCCDCPKCLFVYIILCPYLSDEELTAIFGENLFNKESLDKYFRELAGIDENKPFECVGTRSEVVASLKYFTGSGRKGILTERYKDILNKCDDSIEELKHFYCNENGLNDKWANKLKAELKRLNAAEI